jgi:hypothetical protein
MRRAVGCVAALTRTWTRVYSLGLAESIREGRRGEIESDLWEQQQAAMMQEERQLETVFHILARTLLGIPGDIAWRVELGFGRGSERKSEVPETTLGRIGLGLGLLGALLPVAFGIGFIVSGIAAADGEWVGWVVWGGILILLGGTVVAGQLVVRSSYGRGMALVAVGVTLLALVLFWMAFITVPLGIALLVVAHLRGRTRPAPTGPAPTGMA